MSLVNSLKSDLRSLTLGDEGKDDTGDKYAGLDRFGRIVDQRWLANGGGSLDRYQYAYDENSNVTSKINTNHTTFNETYTYNQMNQLIAVDRPGGSTGDESWDLDALGNMNSVTTSGTAVSRTHNSDNQITGIAGATSPQYDANGNMTVDDQNRTLVWDAWNRLVAIVGSNNFLIKAYTYDAMGRRTSETDGYSVKDLYYIGGQAVEDRVNGTTSATYLWSIIASNALMYRKSNGDGSYYVSQDANLNVTSIYAAGSNATEHFVYSSYGIQTDLDGSWSPSADSKGWLYGYQDLREDPDTGMLSTMTRWYKPSLMRWISWDLIGYADGMNPNAFVGGNPVNFVDPSGLRKIDVAFDAFINGRRGTWMSEPVQWWPGTVQAYFKTDARDFGAFNFDWENGNARVYSMGTIESTKIGHAASDAGSWASSRPGFSERRLYMNSKVRGMGPSRMLLSETKDRAQGGAEQKGEITDDGRCSSTIHFKAAYAYPFRAGPNINYDISFTFEVIAKNKVQITVSGTRNDFPDYEYYIDRKLQWSKYSWWSGPGLWDLGILWSNVGPNKYVIDADTGDGCPCTGGGIPRGPVGKLPIQYAVP